MDVHPPAEKHCGSGFQILQATHDSTTSWAAVATANRRSALARLRQKRETRTFDKKVRQPAVTCATHCLAETSVIFAKFHKRCECVMLHFDGKIALL